MANKKKVDKELDKLLQEKKKVDNTTSVKKNTTNKSSNSKKKSTSSADKKSTYTKKKGSYTNSKKKSTNVSTNTKKKTTSSSTPTVKETVVAPERKKYTKKKEAIVAPERKPKTTPKKPVKKTITVSQKEKLKENNPKKEVTELKNRMDQLEDEMRNLYEKDQQEDRDPIVEVYPTDDDSKVEIIVKQQPAITEEETPYEVGKHEETSVEEKVEDAVPAPVEDVSHELETDVAVRSEEDDISTLKKRVSALTVITIILSIIFVLLLIAVIAFIVYVCTY